MLRKNYNSPTPHRAAVLLAKQRFGGDTGLEF
jgi:hypothetical protein